MFLLRSAIRLSGTIYLDLASFTSGPMVLLTVSDDSWEGGRYPFNFYAHSHLAGFFSERSRSREPLDYKKKR